METNKLSNKLIFSFVQLNILPKLLIFARKYVSYLVIAGSISLVALSNISFANNNVSSFLLAPLFENNGGGGEIIESAKTSDKIGISSDILAPIANAETEYQPNISTYIIVQNNSLIASAEPLTTDTSQERSDVTRYTVQKGDTPSSIAAAFGITTNTLLWANDLKPTDIIKPGLELTVLPTSGVKHKVKKNDTVDSIAKKYKAEPEKILAFNDLPADGRINEGQELVVPDGEIPPPPAPPKPKPVPATKLATQNKPASIASNTSGYYVYPTTGRNWGRIHSNNGVDVANSCGTPIYAAAEGSVNTSRGGWNGGYGTYVKINHPNGTETLYGHLSTLGVSVGEGVSKGQFIGYMGTTGRSTGCHLHFEVHGAKNPLAR